MALSSAWFCDRSPGAGKQLIVNGLTLGVNGVIGLGQPGSGGSSTPPATYAVLPQPGTTIPARGDPARAAFFLAFKEAVGFNGSTVVQGWAAGTRSNSFSLSVWLNYGVMNIVGFTPNPDQGVIYEAEGFSSLVSNSLFAGTALNLDPSGLQMNNGSTEGLATGIVWPEDLGLSSGWVHVMMSYQGKPTGTADHYQICLNDTMILDSMPANSGNTLPIAFDITSSGPTVVQSIGGNAAPPISGDGLYAAMTELWVAQGHYVDWSQKVNRYKFHTSDGFAGSAFETFAPVDIGASGSRPFGYTPTLYLTGGPALFPNNRATGLALNVVGTGLVAVDDPPT